MADKVVCNARVTACSYRDGTWNVVTEDGTEREADAVIVATGQLHQPAYPRLEGRDAFEGHQFHSARWDHDYDLRGKEVAVVGTGASAVQFVPEIAPLVKKLHVFQRSGNWFLPRRNRPYPPWYRRLFALVPGLQAYRRWFVFNYGESLTAMIRHPRTVGLIGRARSAAFMRWQLRDREVRRKAWPDYTFGCKRVLFSSHWLPALQRPNVELITDEVTGLTADGVTTADGIHRKVDCIIWGTGFRTNDFMLPMEITGTDGTLADHWAGAPRAHLGITVPGFPSLFLMYGPNTNTSGGSIIAYEEAQAGYIRQAIELAGDGAVEVRADGGRGLGPRDPGALRRHRLDPLRLLVPPGPRRAHRRQLAGLHAPVLRPRPRARPGRVPRAQPRARPGAVDLPPCGSTSAGGPSPRPARAATRAPTPSTPSRTRATTSRPSSPTASARFPT